MNDLDSQIGKYKVTARLFNFINDLPQDKQYILYKQLIKGNVTTELFKLIIDMPEDGKNQLLEQLDEIPYEEERIRTINLDENESFMREDIRSQRRKIFNQNNMNSKNKKPELLAPAGNLLSTVPFIGPVKRFYRLPCRARTQKNLAANPGRRTPVPRYCP